MWLEYSVSKDAAFCYPCRFFSHGIQKGHTDECFITTGFRNWKNATGMTGRLVRHTQSQRHVHASAAWIDFKHNQQSHTSIASALSMQRQEQVQHNRHYLKTIIEVLLYCAFQEIALRGHRESESSRNRGNFMELLHIISNHDTVIKGRLHDGPRNALYPSHHIQDELLKILSEKVIQIICQKVKQAEFYSIIVDESRDTAKQEQMSFAVCYVDVTDGCVHEHFFSFIHAESLDAASLASYIRKLVATYDFSFNKMVSQGYDGASVMSGHCTGVQTRVREFAPYAIYIHCYAHILNLVLVDSVKSVPCASEFFSLLEAIYVFVSSSKIHVLFMKKQCEHNHQQQPLELQKLSDTCWVCRYAAVNAVCRTLDSLIHTIEEVADSSINQHSQVVEGRGLYHQITSFSFIVSLVTFD
jgi:hypothetical protein